MPRLAWFTPLPPARTGIAAYSMELLPLLAGHHAIEVFFDAAEPPEGGALAHLGLPAFPARDFVWRNLRQPFDLAVYQLGNSPSHDFMWPYLIRFPGFVVLHDGQLHHSRARALLSHGREDDYRAEFEYCHPGTGRCIADSVIRSVGGSHFYLWPLIRVPIEASRLVGVHGNGLAEMLRNSYPGRPIRPVHMGVEDPGIAPEAGLAIRGRHGIAEDAVVFAAFGMLTPEKRLPEILRAFRSVAAYVRSAHLLLVGQEVEHYDVRSDAAEAGVAGRVTVAGYVADEDLAGYLNAADICLSLRWPTSRETSAAWLRCLAAGKATVITDLVHTVSVPALDPRSWTALEPVVGLAERKDTGPPVCVAIDILDEQHSLGLAMRRLAVDRRLRTTLGERARQYWATHHTPRRMADDYIGAIDEALACPVPDLGRLPAHLRADGTEEVVRVVGDFGMTLEDIGFG